MLIEHSYLIVQTFASDLRMIFTDMCKKSICVLFLDAYLLVTYWAPGRYMRLC